MSGRIYERQRKGVHRGDNWERIKLGDLPDRGPTGSLRRKVRRLPTGAILYTMHGRYRVRERAAMTEKP